MIEGLDAQAALQRLSREAASAMFPDGVPAAQARVDTIAVRLALRCLFGHCPDQ